MLEEKRKKQLLDFCKTCIEVYKSYLTNDELKLIDEILKSINDKDLKFLEERLMPIVSKIWEIELDSDKYIIISWNKFAKEKNKHDITFATISRKDEINSFCDLKEGTEYKISFASLIGALNKDGATLIEDLNHKNEYTIATVGDKVINSYNGATRLITPYQLVSLDLKSDYKSNYNELILRTDMIEEIGPYTLDSSNKLK